MSNDLLNINDQSEVERFATELGTKVDIIKRICEEIKSCSKDAIKDHYLRFYCKKRTRRNLDLGYLSR